MQKSRRGLLAAGLSAAVIGAIGVVSTLNAGAEQIPDAPAPVAVPADETDVAAPPSPPAAKPPTNLPWGERPRSVRTGRHNATSKSLKVAGLSAAHSDDEGRDRAPKGRTSRTTFLQSEKTNVVPPEPAPEPTDGVAPARPTVHFLYNVGSQKAEADAAYANLTISKPKLARSDYHTLAELAVQSADGKQIVEVGWNVDRVVNGDDDPHLFVYHWVDRQTSCYNGCGFVQYSKNIQPGDTLVQDSQKRFGIQNFNGDWWIAYDTEWVGYFPGDLWGGTFTRSGLVQVFGEVAAATEKPCTEMGNGKGGDDTTSAKVGSVAYLNGPTVDLKVRSTSDLYSVSKLSSRTFRYGGAGAC
ncbi:neprosin family prolyl endopeptidase [Actinoplanes aureus]|uniref:neprosin family prolyl endopeptidase n=1 Tax=Actinoplanes aureus TaxID=2792083 RepID=UPI002814F1CC|nr:neprosin family prolyl endopeptidase [Actinoplanes aureus]